MTTMPLFSNNSQGRGGAVADPILPGVPIEDQIAGGDPVNRPASFSLRSKMATPGVQMNWDCVGWAGAYLKEFLEHEETGVTPDLSAMFIYAKAKTLDGYAGRGTNVSMGTYIPERFGIALEFDYPEVNLTADPAGMPAVTEALLTSALKYKSKSSVMVERGSQDTFEGLKQALWRWKRPIVIGADWYTNSKPGAGGILPKISGSVIYGHCTTMIGYDDTIGVEFINSYGQYWGDHGFGWYPHGFPVYATGWTSIDLPNDWEKPEAPKAPAKWKRDVMREQRNASVLQASLYAKFLPTDRARPYAGRNWFMLVDAMTYLGYSATDIVNFLYAKTHKDQVIFDLSKQRPR